MRNCFVAATCLVLVSLTAAASPLVDAVKANDVSAVRALLRKPLSVDTPEAGGATALHWAAHRNNPAILDLLISARSDVNARDDHGVTPLALASGNGAAALVRSLLSAGADPNAASTVGETPLMLAARAGSADVASLLLQRGAEPNAREHYRGQSALMWASAGGHVPVATLLLDHRADPNQRSQSGFTALMFAAQQGHPEIAALLLDRGAQIDAAMQGPAQNGIDPSRAEGATGLTSLLIALDSGIVRLFRPETARRHADVVRLLLARGADPNLQGGGRRPIHAAVWSAQPDMVRLLLDTGADPNAKLTARIDRVVRVLGDAFRVDMRGATSYWLAARLADTELMRLLAERGADTTARTNDGTTPLMIAAGLDAENPGWDRYGRKTPDDALLGRRTQEAAELALTHGGNVRDVNNAGLTALHGAALAGANRTVEWLVALGADINARSKDGLTPFAVANEIATGGIVLTRTSTATLLVTLGADPASGKSLRVEGGR